jgi:arginine/ornithine N-succinyltransferase beta subunit
MNRSDLTAAALLVVLAAGSTLAAAQDRDRTQAQDKDQTKDQTKDRDQIRDRDIYGSQLMTNEERNQYRTRMRAAKTDQERERIRAEHHERMKVHAKERGVTLPDTPPARGGGMGPGAGQGAGGGAGKGGGR